MNDLQNDAQCVTTRLEKPFSLLKSDNLQYNMLGRWVDRLSDQASVGPSINLID